MGQKKGLPEMGQKKGISEMGQVWSISEMGQKKTISEMCRSRTFFLRISPVKVIFLEIVLFKLVLNICFGNYAEYSVKKFIDSTKIECRDVAQD